MPPMLRRQAGLLFLIMAATATAQAQGALSDEEALSRLTGGWSLVGWDETLADGRVRKHGVTEGRIIYTPLGEMCAVVMDPNRPDRSSVGAPIAEEVRDGTDSRLRLRIDEAELRAPVVRSELIWERVTE